MIGGEPERDTGTEAEVMVALGEPSSCAALEDGHDGLRAELDGLIGVIPNARRTE
jgi:hypothetical protein